MQRVLAQHALRETNIENRCYPRHCLPSWEVPTHFHQYDLEHISQNQKVFTTIIPSMLTYVVLMVVVTLS